MDTYEIVEHCRACKKPRRHIKRKTNHILHLVLTILTGGMWVIVWAWYGITNRWHNQCTECGLTDS